MKYRHFKGGVYTVICQGVLESDPDSPDAVMVAYRCDKTGKVWIRPAYEFYGYKEGVKRFRLVVEETKQEPVCNCPPFCPKCATLHHNDEPCREIGMAELGTVHL